ncbi:MAG: tRNA guanosine(34) transglycosylase Tgt [Planctomycetota bacterium]|jgi:queuine tRNA-ribosyltransferase|nr:tRNA guanosine(34) transglycosylase Tgt [Planctomycetota bacterium]
MSLSFRVAARDGLARAGVLETPHGAAETPLFMAVGTAASVKGMTSGQLRLSGARMLLANAYHLAIRPGAEAVAARGGLARFMGWDGPTLTDSGGYQVFSLARRRRITPDGVVFNNHIDGRELFLGPERAVEIQAAIGADIQMCLDVCPPARADREGTAEALALTHAWAERARRAWNPGGGQALFGIVQGGLYEDFRRESAARLAGLDLPGYAVGGVAVGEETPDIRRVVSLTAPLLPEDKPRYLMGVGTPADIVHAAASGIDMFDCVMPTRHARHGQAFTRGGTLNLRNARFADDDRPIEEGCDCETCRTVSRAYLRHLARLDEIMAPVWLTIHNVRFYLRLLEDLRRAIRAGRLEEFRRAFAAAEARGADPGAEA